MTLFFICTEKKLRGLHQACAQLCALFVPSSPESRGNSLSTFREINGFLHAAYFAPMAMLSTRTQLTPCPALPCPALPCPAPPCAAPPCTALLPWPALPCLLSAEVHLAWQGTQDTSLSPSPAAPRHADHWHPPDGTLHETWMDAARTGRHGRSISVPFRTKEGQGHPPRLCEPPGLLCTTLRGGGPLPIPQATCREAPTHLAARV